MADAAAEKHARKQAKKAAEKAKKAAMREKFESSGGGGAAELAEAAAAAKRTPEEQAREEAKAAARAKYEAAQKAGEEKNAAMRLAADKIKNKGMTGSSLMKNRQAGKLSAGKKTEKGDDELKDKSESEIFNTTGMSKNWFYFGVFIVVFSFLGTFYSQLTARSGGQGPPRN